MKFSTAATAVPVLALLPGSLASDHLEKRGLSCSTVFGSKSAKQIPTSTKVQAGRFVTRTARARGTVYFDRIITATLTGTVTEVETTTSTKTAKATTVTVTGSSTSTVGTVSGFVPAAAALPTSKDNRVRSSHKVAKSSKHAAPSHHATKHASIKRVSSKTAKAKSSKKHKRDAAPEPAQKKKTNKSKKGSKGSNKPVVNKNDKPRVVPAQRFPQRVDCTERNAIAGGAVITVTVTQDIKPAVTKYNDIRTVTIDRRRTKTQEVTQTVTWTPRRTVELPRATNYAACAENNLLGYTFAGSASGNASFSGNATFSGNGTSSSGPVGINSVTLSSAVTAQSYDTVTASLCCIRCQLTDGCVGSQWRSGRCVVLLNHSFKCSASPMSIGSFFSDSSAELDPNDGLILSNGQCAATWTFGGSS